MMKEKVRCKQNKAMRRCCGQREENIVVVVEDDDEIERCKLRRSADGVSSWWELSA